MHYRQIETFRAVMLCGSASRAADLLDITQPAVSRSVAELERSVGFSLFDRVRGRLVPTKEASLLFAAVDKAFVGLDQLRAEAARIRDLGAGGIRIACLAALGATLVPAAIRSFQKKHRAFPLTLQIHPSSVVRELIVNGSFDIGLAADEVDLIGIRHEPFGHSVGMVALPPGDPLASKPCIEPADIAGRNLIALAAEDRARHRLDAVLHQLGIRPKIVVETPNSSTICALALAGVGVGLVNPAAAAGFDRLGLVLRPFKPTIEFRQVLLLRGDAQNSRHYKSLVKELYGARAAFAIHAPP